MSAREETAGYVSLTGNAFPPNTSAIGSALSYNPDAPRAWSPGDVQKLFERVAADAKQEAGRLGDECILALARREDQKARLRAELAWHHAKVALSLGDYSGKWGARAEDVALNYLLAFRDDLTGPRDAEKSAEEAGSDE